MEEEKKGTESKYAGLSKGQIKKLKEKEKKEKEAAAEQATPVDADAEVDAGLEDAKEDTSAASKGSKAKKGKKSKGGLSEAAKKALFEKQQAQREEDELRARLQRELDERIAREEAEAKAAEDEARAIAEEKKRVKLEEKNKLKAEGKWLTKKQLALKKIADARRKGMIEAGLIPADVLHDEDEKGGSTMVRKIKKNKKKNPAQNAENNAQTELDAPATENLEVLQEKLVAKKLVQAAPVQAEQSEEKEFDDWEDAIDDVAETIAQKAKRENLPIAKDYNEEFSSEEEKEVVVEVAQKKEGKKKEAAVNEAATTISTSTFDQAIGSKEDAEARRKRQLALLEARKRRAQPQKKAKNLRCPIICIMGHVDTGKTLILDKLRKTNVQANEAGGITQQIGATYFPSENIQKHIDIMASRQPFDLEIPGFLVIDTPGHESFTNLRSRGSSLCDLAVLVVDIMHGLEQQTLESLNMLKQKNVPFCIALNKIDRLNQWVPNANLSTRDTIERQNINATNHFEAQLQKTILAFNEQGFNVALYWENDSPQDTLSFVPTSAITGEGLSDLIYELCKMGQTTEREKLTEKEQFECTVLEVKVIEGHGTTIDVVLVNGVLKVGDTIVISGLNGPIRTNIRALLTPFPMKEMRVKGEYMHHNKIKGSMGIKISAPGLDHAIAGSELFKCSNEQEVQDAKDQIEGDLVDILEKYVDKTKEGVCVQSSTIGSLEALLEFLYQMEIPVCSVNIGPVHKKDLMKAMKSLVGTSAGANKEYACLLAFDVKIMPDATAFAEENNIKVFSAKIIYHLFDEFKLYVEECKTERRGGVGHKVVFPAICQMVPDACFNRSDPIIIGLNVVEGILKPGTPLCVPDRDRLRLGTVISIEANKKPIQSARAANGSVAVKIANEGSVAYGRHFDDKGDIVSLITRESIDILKQHFREEMTDADWRTCIKLKKLFDIA